MTTTYMQAIDITDAAFGADPTGINDSTAAIQAAIDYYYNADDSMNRGLTFGTPGIYKIDPTVGLLLKDNIKITGAGWGSTELVAANTSAGALMKRASGGRHQYQHIEGFRFTLTGANQLGIDAENMSRAKIIGNKFGIQRRKSVSSVGEWYNTPSTIMSGTFGVRLYGSSGNATLLRENIFELLAEGVRVDGAGDHNIISNEMTGCGHGINIPVNTSAGNNISYNLIQYWSSGCRGIDTMMVDSNLTHNRFENNVSGALEAVLLRSGSARVKADHNHYFLYSPASTTKLVDNGTSNVNVF